MQGPPHVLYPPCTMQEGPPCRRAHHECPNIEGGISCTPTPQTSISCTPTPQTSISYTLNPQPQLPINKTRFASKGPAPHTEPPQRAMDSPQRARGAHQKARGAHSHQSAMPPDTRAWAWDQGMGPGHGTPLGLGFQPRRLGLCLGQWSVGAARMWPQQS